LKLGRDCGVDFRDMPRLGWLILLLLIALAVPNLAWGDGVALAKAGLAAQAQGQWAEAIKLYGQALAAGDLSDASRFKVMGLRANALGVQGRHEEAMAEFAEVIRLDPEDPSAYIGRGIVHLQRGENELAIADDNAALERAPASSFAHVNRATALFYAGRFAEAAADFAYVRKGDPGDAHWTLWLHLARARAGAEDQAEFAANAQAIEGKDWPGPVVAYYLGQASAAEVEQAAAAGETKAWRLQQGCDVSFYFAEEKLLRAEKDEAKRLFQKVLEDCQLYRGNFMYFSRSYGAAKAELARLQ
jgi:lipoprotein NlpI